MTRRGPTLLLSLALALLGVGWACLRSNDATGAPLLQGAATETTTSALRPAALAPGATERGSDAPGSPASPRKREALTSTAGESARNTAPTGALAERARPFDLEVHFRGPDGKTLSLASVRVELSYPSGDQHEASATTAAKVRLSGISPGEAQLLVHAPEHSHWAQRVDLDPSEGEVVRGGARVQSVVAVVWPTAWVAIIVETPKREPFTELARALGLPPQPLFSNAFRARVSAVWPSSVYPEPAHDPALATFRGAPGHKAYVIDERAVGSLELLRHPPMFVGLELYGAVLRWEPLGVNAREVRFVLSESDLDAGLARLDLVVVEHGTHTPIPDARAALRADSSAARRGDHTDASSADDGKLAFTRIVPGRYELLIEHGEAQHQAYVELARGERRDLGRIELGPGAGIDVEVVDANGAPASVFVEIGVYAPGLRPIEMYPQMLRHSSNASGRVRLPSRAGLMVVRAAVENGRSNAPSNVQEVRGVRSPHVVVDPERLPTETIRLVLTEPVRVTVATTELEATRIDVLDSADVVIARESDAREVRFEALPGPHRVRIYDASDTLLRDVAAELTREGQRVQVD